MLTIGLSCKRACAPENCATAAVALAKKCMYRANGLTALIVCTTSCATTKRSQGGPVPMSLHTAHALITQCKLARTCTPETRIASHAQFNSCAHTRENTIKSAYHPVEFGCVVATARRVCLSQFIITSDRASDGHDKHPLAPSPIDMAKRRRRS